MLVRFHKHGRSGLEQCGFSHNIETVNLAWKLENPDELFSAFYQGTARGIRVVS